MTREEKQILSIDLCGRLFHKTKVFFSIMHNDEPVELSLTVLRCLECIPLGQNDIVIKPYLRPMSSMTEEEKVAYCDLQDKFLYSSQCPVTGAYELFDWLNAHHFDYRSLIPMGLALEAPEGMYKIE